MAILEVQDLTVKFGDKNSFIAVNNLSYSVECGKILGIVGESGSGKSVSSLALMGLIDYPGKVTANNIMINGHNINELSKKEHIKLLGKEISMIFQDALTSLDPSYTVGFQIIETLKVHDKKSSKAELTARAVELLTQVGIPDPQARLKAYPYQLSGGMSQRVMVAIAIASNPNILIADEPTTALDVTIQAQIIDLLLDLQKKNNMALVLITHDLALVAQNVDHILVMYAGEMVEYSDSKSLFEHPRHPYTQALLQALPELNQPGERLKSLPGVVPGRYDRPQGCMLHARCPYATDKCKQQKPQVVEYKGHKVLCHYPLNDQGEPTYD